MAIFKDAVDTHLDLWLYYGWFKYGEWMVNDLFTFGYALWLTK